MRTPVLIVYGLSAATRWSICRKTARLCATCSISGVDLYVVDWGNPNRADRYVTIDDYVDGYLDECVDVIARARRDRADQPAWHLRGRRLHDLLRGAASREGAEHGSDDHADRLPWRHAVENRPGHGFINIWTRSLAAEDVDRMIDAYGVLPGEFMGSVFSHDDADALA